MPHGLNEVVLHHHRLVVTRFPQPHLVEQSLLLLDGIDEFRVGLDDLPARHHHLEHVEHRRVVVVATSERHEFGGVVDEETGLHQRRPDGPLVQQVNQRSVRDRVTKVVGDSPPGDLRLEGVHITHDSKVNAGGVTHRRAVVDDRPLRTEVEGDSVEFDGRGPGDFLEGGDDEFTHRRHVVGVVPIGGVPLQHRELLEMRCVDPLVAEVPADLVHPVEPTGHHTLEVGLRGDAQVEVAVKGVVVGRERSCRRT